MYIVQCYYSEAGEEPSWRDLNKWFYIYQAEADLKYCLKMYKKNKTYKWRVIKREVVHKVTDKIVLVGKNK